jgi:transcriptional regulator
MPRRSTDDRLELLQGTLDMLILRTLQSGEQHGYGISQAIRSQSAEVLQVETGSLYPALHRLEQQALIEAEWRQTETGRDAKFYRLTRAGRAALKAETAQWDRLSTAVGMVLRNA